MARALAQREAGGMGDPPRARLFGADLAAQTFF